MAKEFDQNQEIATLTREKHLLLMKVGKLEATHKAGLEARERKIESLKQMLEELDGAVNFYRGELGAKEREARGLKRKLEDQDNNQRKMALLYTVKYKLAKMQIKELQTKVSELENKLEIQDNTISQRLIDENEQVGRSSGVNLD